MRAEVLFINTKEFTLKWGTVNAINIPAPNMPGGLPIRAHGTLNFKVGDYIKLIDKLAGIKTTYFVEDVRTRVIAVLDQLLMKWISKEGKDMFNLQANAYDISKGIQTDLDMELFSTGLSITGFHIMSFTYPEEVQKMINKNASQSMIGDVSRYQQVSMTDGMASGNMKSGGTVSDMAGMMMGMNIANQMLQNMNQNTSSNTLGASSNTGTKPNFCPNCGQKLI